MWFYYALLAAVISGISVSFNKKVLNRGVHSSVVSLFLFLFCTIGGLILLTIDGNWKINLPFLIASFISAVFFSVSKTLQLNIFRHNNLSDIYPLASLSPLTLYLISLFTLQEDIKITGTIGIFIMVVGVYLINFKSGNNDMLHPIKNLLKNKFALIYAFAIIISNISAIAEKYALNNSGDSGVYQLAFWENLFLTMIIGSYVLKTNKDWVKEIKSNLLNLCVAGSLFLVLYLLVISGFKEGPVSLVSAVKKFEVIIVLLISYLFFKERPSKHVYLGSVLMILAVIFIRS